MFEKQDNVFVIDILYFARAFMHNIWAVLLIVAILGASSFFYAATCVTPKYSATAMIYVNNTLARIDPRYAVSDSELDAAERLVDTYIVILNTPSTIEEIIEKSGVDYTNNELKSMISAASQNDTEIFAVRVTSEDPEEAILIANTITKVLPRRIAHVVDGSAVKTVQKAYTAPKTAPNKTLYALVGAMLGFILACGVIIIRELKDGCIYGEEYIQKTCQDVPILASIPDLYNTEDFANNYYYGSKYGSGYYKKQEEHRREGFERDRREHREHREHRSGVNFEDRIIDTTLCKNLDFVASEAYKTLRTNLMYILNTMGEDGKVIGVTSSNRAEGKSTTAINLSYVLAQAGLKVVTVDCDLRLPTVAKKLRMSSRGGFVDVFNGKTTINEACKPSGLIDNWSIITSGSNTNIPSEIVGSDKSNDIFNDLRDKFDIVIVDLPPVNEVTDSMAICPYLDGIVFIVRQRKTLKLDFNLALGQLQLAGAPLTGFVLAGSDGRNNKYDKYNKYGNYFKTKRNYYYYKKGYYYGGGQNPYASLPGYGQGYGYGYGAGNLYGQGYGPEYGYGYGYGLGNLYGKGSNYGKGYGYGPGYGQGYGENPPNDDRTRIDGKPENNI